MDCSTVTGTSMTICLIQPFDWRIYIAPALILISIFVAWRALVNARTIARQKATIDLIEKKESTEHYRSISITFSELRRGKGFDHLTNPQSEHDRAERQAVIAYLNHYELIALGIIQKTLDEAFYRSWMRGPFVRDWNAAAYWMQNERWKQAKDGSWDYYPDTFAHYQKMVVRWSPKAIKLTAQYSGPPEAIEAGGPGNDPLPPADIED